MNMNIIKGMKNTLLSSIRSFPGTFSATFAAFVASSIYFSSDDIFQKREDYARDTFGGDSLQLRAVQDAKEALENTCGYLIAAFAFVAVFAFVAALVCRFAASKKHKAGSQIRIANTALQLFCIPLCVLVYFLMRNAGDMGWLRYCGIITALVFASFYFLFEKQRVNLNIKSLVLPNAVIAFLIAGIASSCLMTGAAIVLWAVKSLIFDFDSMIPWIVTASFAYLFFAPNLFIAYLNRSVEEITIPKAFKVITNYVLLPLALVLLAVLYAYLVKCLVTLKMPVGKLNPFVSIATAMFLFFYFVTGDEIRIWHKWGAILFAPLVVLQIIAFALRISAYGFTPLRVASLFYIIASIAFLVLPFVQNGRYMGYVYLLFAAFALLATCTPLNVTSCTVRNQQGRIDAVYRKYVGIPKAEFYSAFSDKLTEDDKKKIISSWNAIKDCGSDVKGSLMSGKNEEESSLQYFERLFGFEYTGVDNFDDGELYTFSNYWRSGEVDISSRPEHMYCFSTDVKWNLENPENNGDSATSPDFIITLPDGAQVDITRDLIDRLQPGDYSDSMPSDSMLVLHKGKYTVYCETVSMRVVKRQGREVRREAEGDGFVFW